MGTTTATAAIKIAMQLTQQQRQQQQQHQNRINYKTEHHCYDTFLAPFQPNIAYLLVPYHSLILLSYWTRPQPSIVWMCGSVLLLQTNLGHECTVQAPNKYCTMIIYHFFMHHACTKQAPYKHHTSTVYFKHCTAINKNMLSSQVFFYEIF